MYKIKQKYNLKDYVKYYQSYNTTTHRPCMVKYGYVNEIRYTITEKDKVELTYIIGSKCGSCCGYVIKPNRIIKLIKKGVRHYE